MCPSLHLVIFVCSFLLRLENVHLLLKFDILFHLVYFEFVFPKQTDICC